MVFLFFEFKGDEHTKLAVAVINKSNATDINPDLNFIAKEILDLDKLHLGATINITEWRDEFRNDIFVLKWSVRTGN